MFHQPRETCPYMTDMRIKLATTGMIIHPGEGRSIENGNSHAIMNACWADALLAVMGDVGYNPVEQSLHSDSATNSVGKG